MPCLDQHKLWDFKPNPTVKIGSILTGGDIIGHVFENNLFDEHKILIPPRSQGRVTWLATPGNYTIKDKIIELEYNDKKIELSMSHYWPVRQARPIEEKLQGNTPLLTG